jgi:hypothetical protein
MKRLLLCCLLPFLWATVTWSQPTVSATSPTSQTLCSGSSANYTVTASGAAPLSYQWQSSPNGTAWSAISNSAVYSGVTTASLTITNAPATLSGYSYRCVVTNGAGSTNSAPGTLTVNASPVAQTSSQSIVQCSTEGTGSASAVDPSSNYQWQLSSDNGVTWNDITDGTVYTGTQTYDLTWNLSTSMNGYQYRFIISDPTSGCTTTSTGVDTLWVVGAPSTASVSPTNDKVCPGSNANFAVTDSTGVSYDWQYSTNDGGTWVNTTDGTLYTGSAANSLNITDPTTAAWYHVIESVTQHGLTCYTTSTFAPLFIETNASIATQPANTTVCAGIAATFRVVGAGTSPFSYQWQTDNGTSPSVWTDVGTSTASLTTGATTATMNGYHYQVLLTGACGGQLTSQEVTLDVDGNGTWLGTADAEWEDAANWCGGVPVQTTNVLIPAGTPFSPVISATTGTAYSTALTIQSSAGLSIGGGTTSMLGPFSILGSVFYLATGDQPILPADHGTMVIGGTGNKTLSTNTGINNYLYLLSNSVLVTGNDLLTMYAGSNIYTTAPFGSMPSGWIVTGNGSSGAGNTGLGGLKIAALASGATAFFPVGPTPTEYAPAQLTNGGATNDFTIAVNDQNIPGGPTNGTVDRTWLVSAAGSGTSNIGLGLQWDLADEGSLFNRASASIIRSNGAIVVQASAVGSAAGSNPYSLMEGGFSTLTQFSAATSTLIVLADQLLSFNGQWLNGNAIGLTWTVDPQLQAGSFVVQRSVDGAGFINIGMLDATAGSMAYSFTDPHPAPGNNAYRLQVLMTDGSATYSQIVQFSGAAMNDQAGLAPSVTTNGISNLLLSLDHAAELSYTLSDLSGKVLTCTSVKLAGGSHTLPLDVSRLSAGVYFVHITGTDGFNKTLTLIKK